MSRKKLQLNKITIQSFGSPLDSDEQKKVNGGSVNVEALTTVTPVFCPPYPG
jgi:hypothetical protein